MSIEENILWTFFICFSYIDKRVYWKGLQKFKKVVTIIGSPAIYQAGLQHWVRSKHRHFLNSESWKQHCINPCFFICSYTVMWWMQKRMCLMLQYAMLFPSDQLVRSPLLDPLAVKTVHHFCLFLSSNEFCSSCPLIPLYSFAFCFLSSFFPPNPFPLGDLSKMKTVQLQITVG